MSADHLRNRFGLAQKKCLVTGGTKGIGKACVEELAQLGASVSRSGRKLCAACRSLAASWLYTGLRSVLLSDQHGGSALLPHAHFHTCGRASLNTLAHAQVYTCGRGQADLDTALKEWQAKGWDVQGSTADLAEPASYAKLIEAVSAAFGGQLHILVNNVHAC